MREWKQALAFSVQFLSWLLLLGQTFLLLWADIARLAPSPTRVFPLAGPTMSFGELTSLVGARACVLALLVCARPGSGFSVSGHQDGTCEANGSIYYLGEWYFLDSDHCTQCECAAEGPACARTECTSLPAACIHVSHYPTDCCPRCERIGCEYRGEVYELGQNFQPSECEQCTCDSDGIARCLVADCAPPPCVNPVYLPGKCCPECQGGPNCYVDDSRTQVIPAGEPVWVDFCTKCRCHDGQDAGYWEGNRLASCSRLKNCTPEQPSIQQT